MNENRKQQIVVSLVLLIFSNMLYAQSLSLDSCRMLAIQHNKQLQMKQLSQEAAHYDHKAAQTNFLPKLSLSGAYVHNEKEMQLLSDDQKKTLQNIGTSVGTSMTQAMTQVVTAHPELAPIIGAFQTIIPTSMPSQLNAMGTGLVDAFRTNTKNVYLGAVTLMQPLYMGGKIAAYNKITHYAEELAKEQNNQALQEVILSVDQAYWQVIALVNKQRVVDSYVQLLSELEEDVNKMVAQGVSTKADALEIKVKHNEAKLGKIRVDDGVKLSKMLLCQLCGLSMETPISLDDEQKEKLDPSIAVETLNFERIFDLRPEVKSLELAESIYQKKVTITRSDFLPKLAFVGNYVVSNPSCFNGFETKFKGTWNVGITFSMPLWSWREGHYKVRSAKAKAQQMHLQLEEAKEKIQLQVNQALLRINETAQRMETAEKNLASAQENLRAANLGFHEGVIPTTTLLSANTAWLAAKSAYIDAQIDEKLANVYLKKSMGILK